MPIYEYQCPKCSHVFEEWLNTSESENPQPCPKCQSQSQRIVSQTSFVLKGSGWYVTEYGSNSAAKDPNKKNLPANDAKLETKATEKTSSEATSSDAKPKSSEKKTKSDSKKTTKSTTKAKKAD